MLSRDRRSAGSPMRAAVRSVAGIALLLAALPLAATTLLQMTMDDMIRQSTGIVRAKVSGSYGSYRGADIFTHYRLEVLETLKSTPQTPASTSLDVAVPGGAANGLRQSVAGAPTLNQGQEYVVFLWTGRSGMTQVIGLSQGLFTIQQLSGEAVLQRQATQELMLDARGQVVRDEPLTIRLSDLRRRVGRVSPSSAQSAGAR